MTRLRETGRVPKPEAARLIESGVGRVEHPKFLKDAALAITRGASIVLSGDRTRFSLALPARTISRIR